MAERRRIPLAALALWLLVAAGFWLRTRSQPFASFAGEAMATRWQVTLPQGRDAAAEADACFELYRALDLELSEWKPGSPLSAVNRAAGGGEVVVPQELYDLVARSLEIAGETDGAFDISWAALWGTWDFRAVPPRLPAEEEIARRLPLVDYRRVRLDPEARAVELPRAGMQLGLGGIAKGYALARAAALLETRGDRDFLLVGGGQVLARGRRDGAPWRVGVRDPRGGEDDLFARIELSDASLSTSADNESYFEWGGVRYHHVLDPRTGWPARGTRSATVLHRDPVLADALSTALMVMGADTGFPVVERLGGEALVVGEDGRVRTTRGMSARLELLHPPRD